jgi:hypothetical protein
MQTEADTMRTVRKQQAEAMGNAMQMQFIEQSRREQQYQDDLNSLQNKYQVHQETVRFARTILEARHFESRVKALDC